MSEDLVITFVNDTSWVKSDFRPDDLVTDRNYMGTFGNCETEIAARWVVRFLQERDDGWNDFPVSELEAFYVEGRTASTGKPPKHPFNFHRLIPGTHYHVTASRGGIENLVRDNVYALVVTDGVATVLEKFVATLVDKGYVKPAANRKNAIEAQKARKRDDS